MNSIDRHTKIYITAILLSPITIACIAMAFIAFGMIPNFQLNKFQEIVIEGLITSATLILVALLAQHILHENSLRREVRDGKVKATIDCLKLSISVQHRIDNLNTSFVITNEHSKLDLLSAPDERAIIYDLDLIASLMVAYNLRGAIHSQALKTKIAIHQLSLKELLAIDSEEEPKRKELKLRIKDNYRHMIELLDTQINSLAQNVRNS